MRKSAIVSAGAAVAVGAATQGVSNGQATVDDRSSTQSVSISVAVDTADELGLDVAPEAIAEYLALTPAEQVQRLESLGLDVPRPYALDVETGVYIAGQVLEAVNPVEGALRILESHRYSREVGLRALSVLTPEEIPVTDAEIVDYQSFDPSADEERARTELQLQRINSALNAYLWKYEPEFAGLFIDRSQGFRTVVLTTDPSDAFLEAIPNNLQRLFDLERPQHGQRELMALQESLAFDEPTSSAVDLVNDRVIIYSSPRPGRVNGSVNAFDDLVAEGVVTFQPETRIEANATLYGGHSASGGACTWGFTANTGFGPVVMTAAHCADVMTQQGYSLPYVNQQQSGNVDSQINAATPHTIDNFIVDTRAWPYAREITARAAWSNLYVGQGGVCHTGATTGTTCGTIYNVNFHVGYVPGSNRFVLIGQSSNIHSLPGDSGGPAFFGNTAAGIGSGAAGPNSYGRNDHFFGPLNSAETALGATVATK